MATTATSSEEVRSSVASIYSELLNKRKQERETKEEKKAREKEERQQEKEEKKTKEDGTKMSKKERREAEMDNWKEVIVGLTGDDLEYSEKSTTRKKYRKWIDDDTTSNTVLTPKPKKVKKRNYRKEFEPELTMLKNVVADQNKFTLDLQKRFQNAVGPATKDAMPPNKTMVELAAAINASRANSLGLIREIGNLKKTIADLYMKQKKLDLDMNGANGIGNTTDLGLMGSNIAASFFSNGSQGSADTGSYEDSGYQQQSSGYESQNSSPIQTYASPSSNDNSGFMNVTSEPFDPATWDGGPALPSDAVLFETTPHSIVVEWDKANDRARFKAIRDDTGEELIGCPVPTSDPSKLTFNEKDMTVRGEFDESFKLQII